MLNYKRVIYRYLWNSIVGRSSIGRLLIYPLNGKCQSTINTHYIYTHYGLILLDVTHDTIDLILLFGGWPTMAMLNL